MPKMKDEKRISPEETKEMQHIILGILKAIDKVCREHKFAIFYDAGTMLGAVRHQGLFHGTTMQMLHCHVQTMKFC